MFHNQLACRHLDCGMRVWPFEYPTQFLQNFLSQTNKPFHFILLTRYARSCKPVVYFFVSYLHYIVNKIDLEASDIRTLQNVFFRPL